MRLRKIKILGMLYKHLASLRDGILQAPHLAQFDVALRRGAAKQKDYCKTTYPTNQQKKQACTLQGAGLFYKHSTQVVADFAGMMQACQSRGETYNPCELHCLIGLHLPS